MALDLNDNIIKNVRAIIWKREDDTTFFLLTQESSGSFTIPGGCKDLEDIDLRATLNRELFEELGLNSEDYTVTGTDIQKGYEDLYNGNPQSERFGKRTIVFIYLVSNLKKEPIPSHEIKGISWLTREEALKAFNTPHMKELFELGSGI